jgi:hypothetical protein
LLVPASEPTPFLPPLRLVVSPTSAFDLPTAKERPLVGPVAELFAHEIIPLARSTNEAGRRQTAIACRRLDIESPFKMVTPSSVKPPIVRRLGIGVTSSQRLEVSNLRAGIGRFRQRSCSVATAVWPFVSTCRTRCAKQLRRVAGEPRGATTGSGEHTGDPLRRNWGQTPLAQS